MRVLHIQAVVELWQLDRIIQDVSALIQVLLETRIQPLVGCYYCSWEDRAVRVWYPPLTPPGSQVTLNNGEAQWSAAAPLCLDFVIISLSELISWATVWKDNRQVPITLLRWATPKYDNKKLVIRRKTNPLKHVYLMRWFFQTRHFKSVAKVSSFTFRNRVLETQLVCNDSKTFQVSGWSAGFHTVWGDSCHMMLVVQVFPAADVQ